MDTAAASRALGDAWSLHVVDVGTGRTVIAHDAAVPRVPASNAKIVTAAAALLTFGPEHRFVSTVHMGADGLVAVRGGGDPSLSGEAISEIAHAVARHVGPDSSMPRVVLDQGLYPLPDPAPGWQPDDLPWEVRPVVPVSVAVPGSTTAQVRGGMQIAAAIGRRTGGAVAVGGGTVPRDARCIARVRSMPLQHLVYEMLLVSDSNIAEVLARNTAIARGLPPTWGSVGPALTGALHDAGFDVADCTLADGSGLSRNTVLRADLITQVLRAAEGPGQYPALSLIAESLPRAGRTGTLREDDGWFTADQRVTGRVRAKTGTLRDVCALSGYLDHDDGRRSAFSLLVNGIDGWSARPTVGALVAGLLA